MKSRVVMQGVCVCLYVYIHEHTHAWAFSTMRKAGWDSWYSDKTEILNSAEITLE